MSSESRLRESDAILRRNYGEISLHGCSRAGVHTSFAVPELGLLFDHGQCQLDDLPIKTILLSHVHIDHSLGVLRHIALREMQGMSRPKVFLPAPSVEAFHEVFRAYSAMEGRDRLRDEVLVPVEAGDRISLGRGLEVEVLPVRHTAPSVAFLVRRKKRKLRPEFLELPGPEIGRLRREGVVIDESHDEDLLCYVGDASSASLDGLGPGLAARFLITECTYLGEKDREQAHLHGHSHLSEIARRAEIIRSERLILKHFSLKYSLSEIRREADRVLPASLRERTDLFIP